MSAVETPYSIRPALGTWLIPILVFGSLFCVAVVAFLKLFFTYGCSCRTQSDSVEEAGLPRSILTKDLSGRSTNQNITGPVGLGIVQGDHIVLLPKQDYPTPAQIYQHQPVYQEHMHQYIDQESPYPDCPSPQYEVDFRLPLDNQQIYQQRECQYFHHESQIQCPQVYQSQLQKQSYILPPLSPPRWQRPLFHSSITHRSSDSDDSLHLAYDDSYSLSTVFSQESTFCYPLDSILSGLPTDQSFHSEDASFEVPSLKFTPPSVDDFASLAPEPVCSLEDFLQAPEVDQFGRAVTRSKSLPEVSSPKRKSRKNRSIAIIGNSIVSVGASEDDEVKQKPVLRKALGELGQNTEIKKRRRAGGVFTGKENEGVFSVKESRENDGSSCKRKSFMVKVLVPSTNDLWKFWVKRCESLEEFTRRVQEKLGFDITLFVEEDMLAKEKDWRSISGGSKLIAYRF